VDDLELTEEYVFLNVGESEALLAKVYPYNANNQNIIWSTDDSRVASIEDGLITARSVGNTKVFAISEEGSYNDYCFVEVIN
jgi:uncharacterized protein YjdB